VSRDCGISHWVYMAILDYEGVFLPIRNTILDTSINHLRKIRIIITVIDDSGKGGFARMGWA